MPTESATLEPIHDFTAKLLQAGMRPTVLAYLEWRRAARAARAQGAEAPPMPAIGPLSLNLDLTVACNYACDHCIDWDALNLPVRHEEELLRSSLAELARRGLRSVILIGGGEPTLYPGFAGIAAYLKELGLQVAVVSNGSRNERIAEVAGSFTAGDWVRLSLDAGSDATFQAMHKPKGGELTLESICASAARIKERNPALDLGFSFVITWRGARRDEAALVENLGEMAAAARLARAHGFDYISFKPYLTRASEGAEVLDPAQAEAELGAVLARIETQLAEARALEDDRFRVLVSTNLRVLEEGSWRQYTDQPHECHVQALRQVLSPLGVYNCPAHRGVAKARLGGAGAWSGDGAAGAAATARLVEEFDAHHECREVTCLYNPVNWFLENLVRSGADLEQDLGRAADHGDFFL